MAQDTKSGPTSRYGPLATQLNEVLSGARQTLAPHAQRLPAGRMAELDQQLAEFARRRVRIAVYGEVKAGKSTLINAIAGAELSPSAFDPLTSVPVRITYGACTVWRVGRRVVDSVASLERVMRQGARAGEIVVETDADLLQLGGQVDVLDTPGVGSEERFDAISDEVLRSLDAVVLVLRYPALFTQLTRSLMKRLESDIGKLFVVWNLDAACADLSDEDRMRHAETLRANVSGAHELYLVDARAGLRAALAGDVRGQETSGLTALRDSLRRFAASEKRQVVALREAAKRADRWLGEAQRVLNERAAVLEASVTGVRGRLAGVDASAERKRAEVRAAFDSFCREVSGVGEQHAAAARERTDALRRKLRAARRQWLRRGDFEAVDAVVLGATGAYADASLQAAEESMDSVRSAARDFGTMVPGVVGPRHVPEAGAGGREERRRRAGDGRARLLRRLLWRNWYLPDLRRLEREVLEREVASAAEWFGTVARGAEEAGRAVLEARLAEIDRRADAEARQIREEADFDAVEAERAALQRHLPPLAGQRERAARINSEARELLD